MIVMDLEIVGFKVFSDFAMYLGINYWRKVNGEELGKEKERRFVYGEEKKVIWDVVLNFTFLLTVCIIVIYFFRVLVFLGKFFFFSS